VTRESTVDQCEVAIEDGPGQKSRLIARVTCRNGLTASHSLAFEPKVPIHAKFDKTEATNCWAISSRTLRQLMDHFGPGIELLDINTDDDTRVVNFTCFTEKLAKRSANNNEAVLKKPLHTNIAVEMDEFDNVNVQDKLHIIISVKDFRAILQHAQLISGELSTSYSNPGRPMKLLYSSERILCEFILMTVGEKDVIGQKHKNPRATSAAPKGKHPAALDAASHRGSSAAIMNQKQPNQPHAPAQTRSAVLMPLPRPTGQSKPPIRSRQPQFEIRPAPVPPAASARSDSLFVPQDDDDQKWEPLNPDEEETEVVDNDRLLWNCNNTPASGPRISSYTNPTGPAVDSEPPPADRLMDGLEPTQRLSDVRRFGLFSS